MTTITETLDTIYNLDWFSSASKNECTTAVGLKWMLNQVMFVFFMFDRLRSVVFLVQLSKGR